jgi:hypothetical protein
MASNNYREYGIYRNPNKPISETLDPNMLITLQWLARYGVQTLKERTEKGKRIAIIRYFYFDPKEIFKRSLEEECQLGLNLDVEELRASLEDALAKHYVIKNKNGKYRITPEGQDAIAPVLNESPLQPTPGRIKSSLISLGKPFNPGYGER